MAMAIAQNGPGVTGFVTAVKTAYWNHTPMLLVTPQAANKTIGQGGFQEVDQMPMFREMVCYQEEVRDPRSEEHTSELQSLMRISYAVFCLKKKKKHRQHTITINN